MLSRGWMLALISEIDAGKMRIFLSDVMFGCDDDFKKRRAPIPLSQLLFCMDNPSLWYHMYAYTGFMP